MLGDPCPNPPIAILYHSAPWRLQAVHRSASEKRSFTDCTGALLIPRRLLPFLPAVQTFPALSGCPGPRLLPVHGWTGATEGAGSWKGFRAEDSRSGQALVTFPMAWLEDPQEKLYLSEQVIVLLSCALSFLGSLLIICTHVRWPELRSRPRQLLLFLSVADLLSAASYFYGVLRDFQSTSWDCIAQGAVSTFSNTSSFFWTMAVALYLYITIVQSQQSLAEHMVYWFHLISWGIPLVITVAAVCLQKIGYDASYVSVGWCWVNIDAEDKLIWMLLTGKAWEILAYLVLPVLYLRIKKHIGRAHRALSEYRPILTTTPVYQPRAIADKKLIFIPIIFIFLRIWSTIRFILTLCDSPVVHNPILVVLHGIGNSFQGGANCIMFVLCTRVIRTRLLTSLRCCCKSAGPGDFRESAVSEGHASGYGSTGETQDNQKGSPHLPST